VDHAVQASPWPTTVPTAVRHLAVLCLASAVLGISSPLPSWPAPAAAQPTKPAKSAEIDGTAQLKWQPANVTVTPDGTAPLASRRHRVPHADLMASSKYEWSPTSTSPLHTVRLISRLAGCGPGGAMVRDEQWVTAAAGGEVVTVRAPAATTAISRMASLRKG